MTNLARCCKPAPPDAIVGFVTRGKGVSIHRQRCSNVARMRAREPERLIDADWGAPRDEVFPVDIVLEAMDRQGLLRDITEIFSRERINVTAANTLTRNSATRMAFTLEVRSLEALARALALVRDVRACSRRATLTTRDVVRGSDGRDAAARSFAVPERARVSARAAQSPLPPRRRRGSPESRRP